MTTTITPTRKTQAETVIAKFGGACRLAKLLSDHLGRQISDSTVFRWTYARPQGTGGLIPGSSLRNVLAVAAKQVPPVVITREDLYP